jgi:hypothetical protein
VCVCCFVLVVSEYKCLFVCVYVSLKSVNDSNLVHFLNFFVGCVWNVEPSQG